MTLSLRSARQFVSGNAVGRVAFKSVLRLFEAVPPLKRAALAGWPLYLFADDVVCGDAKGHGVGGVWFAVEPDGTKAG